MVKSAYPESTVVIDDKGAFSRDKANTLARKYFNQDSESAFHNV
jgi:hypothetical protein